MLIVYFVSIYFKTSAIYIIHKCHIIIKYDLHTTFQPHCSIPLLLPILLNHFLDDPYSQHLVYHTICHLLCFITIKFIKNFLLLVFIKFLKVSGVITILSFLFFFRLLYFFHGNLCFVFFFLLSDFIFQFLLI